MKTVKARRSEAGGGRKRQRSVAALEWLCDLSGRTARITSIGNRSLLVENYRGILEFTAERIVLGTRCGSVVVDGERLSLTQVRRDALIVEGSIRDVRLPGAEAEHES